MVVLSWIAFWGGSATAWLVWSVWFARGAVSRLSSWSDLADEWQPDDHVRAYVPVPTGNVSRPLESGQLDHVDVDRYVALSA
jgi:hypothetical protein